MDVFEAIKGRRSIRKYRSDPVPDRELKRIFEAAQLAPSAGNRQPWRFVVVRNASRKKALAKAANNQMFVADASAIVAALGDPQTSERWGEKDPMIAVEHMVLAAEALGYGTCWIGAFDEQKVRHALRIPNGLKIVALLPLGMPDERPESKPRKEISEIFFEEEYGRPIS